MILVPSAKNTLHFGPNSPELSTKLRFLDNSAQHLVEKRPVLYNLPTATVAQSVEQTFRKRQVMGSIPFGGSN
jgi:hypothetical protein